MDRDIPAENLRLLVARGTSSGSPEVKQFISSISDGRWKFPQGTVSNWLNHPGTLNVIERMKVENSLDLPADWLSQDLSFMFTLDAQTAGACRRLSKLKPEAMQAVAALIALLAQGEVERDRET